MRKTAYVSALTAVAVLGGAATASAADPVTSKYLLNVTDGQVKARATPSTAFATSAAPVTVFGTRTTDADTPETAVLEGFKVPATTVATGFTQTLSKGDPAVTTTLKSDVTLAATTLHGTETLTGADKGKVALSGPAKLVFKVSSTVGTAAAKTATCNVTTNADLALASKPDVTTPGTGTGSTASGTYAGKARGTDNAVAVNGVGASTVAADGADPDGICADLGTALGLTGTGADDKLAVRLAGTLAPRPLADYTGAFTSNSFQFGTAAPAAVGATSIPFKTDGDTDALATLDATKAAFALPTGAFVVKLGATPADTFVTVAFPTAADVAGEVNIKDGAKIAGKGDGLFYDTALPAKVTPTYTFGAKQCAPAAPVDLDLVADRDEDGDVTLGADAAQKDQALSQADGTVAYTAGTTVTALKPVGTTATQAECDELVAKYATTFGSDDLKLRLAGTLKPTPTTPSGGGTNDGGGLLSLLPLLIPQAQPSVTTPVAPKPVAKVKAKPHVTAKTPSRVRRGKTVTVKVKVRNASKVGVGTKLRLKVTVPKGLKISGSKKKTVGTLKARKTKTITLKFRTSRSTKSTNRVRFSVSGTNTSSAKGSVRIRVR